jgi:hypothetical protein
MKIVDKIVDWLITKLLDYKFYRQKKNNNDEFIYP